MLAFGDDASDGCGDGNGGGARFVMARQQGARGLDAGGGDFFFGLGGGEVGARAVALGACLVELFAARCLGFDQRHEALVFFLGEGVRAFGGGDVLACGFQRGFCTAQVGFGLFAAACIQRVGAGGFDFGQRLSGAHAVAGLQGDAAQGAGDGCVDVVAVFQAGAAFFVVGLLEVVRASGGAGDEGLFFAQGEVGQVGDGGGKGEPGEGFAHGLLPCFQDFDEVKAAQLARDDEGGEGGARECGQGGDGVGGRGDDDGHAVDVVLESLGEAVDEAVAAGDAQRQ